MFKLAKSAEKKWRRLNGHQKIIPLLQGIKFTNGLMQDAA
jgi:putative transposase